MALTLTQTGTGKTWTSGKKEDRTEGKTSAFAYSGASPTAWRSDSGRLTLTKMTEPKAPAKPALSKTEGTALVKDALTQAIFAMDPVIQTAQKKKTARVELSRAEEALRAAEDSMDYDASAAAAKNVRAAREALGRQTVGDRAMLTLSGAAKSTGSGFAGAAGMLAAAPAAVNQMFTRANQSGENANARDNIARYQAQLAKTTDPKERDRLEALILSNQRRLQINREALSESGRPSQTAAGIFGAADLLSDSAGEDIARAKRGLGTLGQLAVDAGVAGGQMLGDAAIGAVTGGGALVPMAVRSLGSSAQEARRAGADLDRQLLYGLGSAALSVGTEQISNIAAPFRKMFGRGYAEKIAGALANKYGESAAVQLMQRLSQSAAGRIALSAIGEGGEEVVESALQPVLKRMTYDPGAKFDPAEAGHDFLVGAILGGLGGVPEAVAGRVGKTAQNRQETALSSMAQAETGTDASWAASGTQGVQGAGKALDIMEQEIQRIYGKEKTAPETGAADVSLVDRVRESIPRTQNMAPVVELTGTEIPTGGKIVDRLTRFINTIGGKVNRPGFGDVLFSRGRIKSAMVGHGIGQSKIDTFAAVPAVIQKGLQIDQQKNWKGRSYDTYTFAAPVTYQGQRTVLGVIVTKDTQNSRYYLHEVVDADGNLLFKNNESPTSASDGTSALSGDLDTVTDVGALNQSPSDGRASQMGAVDTVGTLSVEGTRPLNSDSSIARGAEFVKDGGMAAVNENGLIALTGREKVNLSSGKKNKIISTFSDAVHFVQSALSNRQDADRAYLGKIPDAVAKTVLEETGLDIRGFGVMLNGNDVRHIMKSHGDPFVETARGQIAVTSEDIAHIPEILSSPDHVYASKTLDGKGRTALVFEKQIDGKYITIQGISDGKKALLTDTLYIQKGRTRKTRYTMPGAEKSTVPVINAQGDPPQGPSAEGASSPSADSTIARGAEFVKDGGMDPLMQAIFGGGRVEQSALSPEQFGRLAELNERGTVGMDADGKVYQVKPEEHIDRRMDGDSLSDRRVNAARAVAVPTTDFDGRNISKSASTVMGAKAIPDDVIPMIEQMIADGKLSYDPVTNAAAEARARLKIRENGFDGAMQEYRAAVQSGKTSPDIEILGQTLLNNAANARDGKATAELLSLYQAGGTNLGQAMQARRIMRKLSPEYQLYAIQRSVYNIDGENIKVSPELIQKFLDQTDQAGRDAVMEEIVKDVAGQLPGSWGKIFDSIRYLAMLGNTRTHVRNMVGNTVFQPFTWAKNRLGGIAEAVVQKSGVDVERTKTWHGANPFGSLAKEARAEYKDIDMFLGQGKYSENRTGRDAIMEQYNPFRNVKRFQKLADALDWSVGRLSRSNMDLLEKEDYIAKAFIYGQTLSDYLHANGVESIDGASSELLARARNYAAQEALRNTFNDKNVVSDAVAYLGRVKNSENPLVKGMGYAVEGTLPFKRTPANVAVRAVEYSPAGAAKEIFSLIHKGATGKANGETISKSIDRLAAGLSGSGLAYLGYLLAKGGLITGGDDEDEDQRNFDDLTGRQSYALELANGTSFTLDWLAPSSIPFFMGVELARSSEDGKLSAEDTVRTLKNMSSPMLEMSMLQGLNDAFEDAAYAQQHDDSVLFALLVNAAVGYFTQAIPTAGGQIERTGEDVRMTTYTDANSNLPKDLQYLLGKTSQKVPGWDFQQIPYIDAWGRVEETGDFMDRLANNFANPAYLSQVQVGEVEGELQRLKDATGNGGVFPSRAPRYFTVDGERKDLTAEEYRRYAVALGQTSYTLAQEAIALPAYREMNDGEKADYIEKLYDYADQQAKEAFGYTPASWVKATQTAQRELGLSPAAYLAMSAEMDSDGSGRITQEEARAYLDKSGYGQEKKADLWDIISASWKKNPYRT